jgi:hypothetical protein
LLYFTLLIYIKKIYIETLLPLLIQINFMSHRCQQMARTKLLLIHLRGDQEGLFKLVTLDRILNRITGVTSGCWWLVVVNNIPISDICQINQQNISRCSVINNRIKKFS